jgi:hypothetical protein
VGRVVVSATAQATITSTSWVHSMKQHLYTLATAVLLTMALGGTNAFASDGKNYAGASCQPAFPADHSIAYYYGGRVRNISDTWSLMVSCPIINDHDNGISAVSIAVEDRHPGLNPEDSVSCNLRSWWVNDMRMLVHVDSRMFSTQPGTAPGIAFLQDGSVSLPRGDYYELSCTIPPRYSGLVSGILYYKVFETTDSVPY